MRKINEWGGAGLGCLLKKEKMTAEIAARLCYRCLGLLQKKLIHQARTLYRYKTPCFQPGYFQRHIHTLGSSLQDNSNGSGIKRYWGNTFITSSRAMEDYLLSQQDLEDLSTRTVRTADNSDDTKTTTCYLKHDVEKRALEVWGSWQNLTLELTKKRLQDLEEQRRRDSLSALIAHLKKGQKDRSRKEVEAEAFGRRISMLKGSARVVVLAIASNTAVLIFKLTAYLYTGSAAMLSEAIHSLADVLNQCLLAFGISQSIRKPDPSHPYGFSRARYVYSLISGVGIFFIGSGVTVYHGIMGLLHPPTLTLLPAAFGVLMGSLLVEGATLIAAVRQVKASAKETGMTFKDYVLRGRDPSAVAVMVEDSAAVGGVFLAAACLGLAHYTGNAVYDAIGSITIGGLLGILALFLIQRNSTALVGRSIPSDRLKQITDLLESDRVVRSIHDVKATDLGADTVRFKAEVNFDGREVTKVHISRLDLEKILLEIKNFSTAAELEKFLLEHGDHVVDTLGSEVDRIELKIKREHPEIRHLDLEIL